MGGGYGARPLESENYVIFRHDLPWISHQYTLASNKLLCMQRWGGGGRITVLRPPILHGMLLYFSPNVQGYPCRMILQKRLFSVR